MELQRDLTSAVDTAVYRQAVLERPGMYITRAAGHMGGLYPCWGSTNDSNDARICFAMHTQKQFVTLLMTVLMSEFYIAMHTQKAQKVFLLLHNMNRLPDQSSQTPCYPSPSTHQHCCPLNTRLSLLLQNYMRNLTAYHD